MERLLQPERPQREPFGVATGAEVAYLPVSLAITNASYRRDTSTGILVRLLPEWEARSSLPLQNQLKSP